MMRRRSGAHGAALLVATVAFAALAASCGTAGDSTGAAGASGGGGGAAAGAAGGASGTPGDGGGGGTIGTAGVTGSAGAAGTAGATATGGTTGAAGRGGTTGVAGTTGAAGATGAAGTTGAGGSAVAGRGGTTGAGGGAAGRGGTTGAAGNGGNGGNGGSTGAAGIGGAGRGGAAGTGSAGRGGTTGSAGTTGAGGSASVDAGGWDAPPLPAMVTIHVAGDSTAAVFPASDATMRVGWAAVLDPLFDSSVMVNDAALSGRSSKSFIDEGAWATLEAKIKPGDYLFVEFAHNDEKTDDPARYTDPATTYRTNLRTYINGARARGGFPVLLTSICRRQFSGNTVTATHGAYTTAMFAVGQETGTPVIDMEKRTKDWLMALGPTASVAMFASGDNTHLIMPGAVEVAKLAVAGIRAAGLPIAARALP